MGVTVVIASHAKYVGRVGALAVVLGVGSAVIPGSAWADEPADSQTLNSGHQESVSADTSLPRSLQRSDSSGVRAQNREVADSNARSGSTPRGTTRTRRGTGMTADRSLFSSERKQLREHVPTAASVPARVHSPTPPARTSVVGIAGSEQPTVMPLVPSVAVDAQIAPFIPVAPSVVTLSTLADQSALSAPELTASTRVRDMLVAIFGTGPTSVPQSPLSWALLGWTRRQSAVTVTEVAAASTQTTSQPLLASANNVSGLPDELERVTLTSELTELTDFRFLPNGAILITEKSGTVRVFQNNELQLAPLITMNVLTEV